MAFDAIVIGGSFAGLSAAIQIARACRSVCIIDAGQPRNRFARASHGLFGLDGQDPATMIAAARAQMRRYPTVQFRAGLARAARVIKGGFEVDVGENATLTAARLVLAFGVADVLPNLPGLEERWGESVLHCPYCHGFEFAGRRLGVLYTMPMSIHQALLVADWGPTTLFLNGSDMPDGGTLAQLKRREVAIEAAPVMALQGEGRSLSSLLLEDGRELPVDALYLSPRTGLQSPIGEQLRCALDDGPFGPLIRTDAAKLTTVPGVYASGDIARVPHNVSWASADGVTAGISLHQSLVTDALAD